MANYHAAAAIGETLSRVLKAGAPADDDAFSGATFPFLRDLNSPPDQGVSLYLYRVTVSGSRNGFPAQEVAPGRRRRRALPLDLYYMLTGWSTIDARRQALFLVWAMRFLEDLAVLPGPIINQHYGTAHPPFRADEAVQLALDSLSLQDQINIWEVAKGRMQPSVVLLARCVPIDSEESDTELPPVQTRQFVAGGRT